MAPHGGLAITIGSPWRPQAATAQCRDQGHDTVAGWHRGHHPFLVCGLVFGSAATLRCVPFPLFSISSPCRGCCRIQNPKTKFGDFKIHVISIKHTNLSQEAQYARICAQVRYGCQKTRTLMLTTDNGSRRRTCIASLVTLWVGDWPAITDTTCTEGTCLK